MPALGPLEPCSGIAELTAEIELETSTEIPVVLGELLLDTVVEPGKGELVVKLTLPPVVLC